jgi:UDP:flavonoid glycosyltransferase YjiC (YdhE family)
VRISVLTLGTRGDTEPYVALGAGLRRAGHEVRIAALRRFEPLIADHGLDFVALPGDTSEMFRTEAWRQLVVRRWNWTAHVGALREMLQPLVDQLRPQDVAAACDGADAILFSSTTIFGRAAAEERGLPAIMTHLGPFLPTWEFPHPTVAPGLRLGRLGNRLSYALAQRLARDPLREPIKPRARAAVGLSPIPLRGTSASWPPFPVIAGYSPTVLPRPADWPPHVHQTGFWLTDSRPGATLPAGLAEFLAAGAAPVYVTFGSMRPREAERLLGVVLEAVQRLGWRVVLGSGFQEAARSVRSPAVFVAEELPHELALPRFRAIVHHGGVGTLARGLRTGLPTLVVPFVFDQSFWGRRIAALGAGPPPIPRHRLTADRLVEALETLERPDVRTAAGAVGERLRAEDGVGDTVRLIERIVGE